MPSITNGTTSTSFITLKGQPQPQGLMLEDITRMAVNGQAYREMAKHAELYEMVGHLDVDNLAAVKTKMDAITLAYSGRVVTVTDDLGGVHTNVVCLKVERVDSFKLLTAVGGVSTSKGAMLIVRFTLQQS